MPPNAFRKTPSLFCKRYRHCLGSLTLVLFLVTPFYNTAIAAPTAAIPQIGASVLHAPFPVLVVLTPAAPVALLATLLTLLAKLVASLWTELPTLLALEIAASALLFASPVAVTATLLKLATTLDASARPEEIAEPATEVMEEKSDLALERAPAPSEVTVPAKEVASEATDAATEVTVDAMPAPADVKSLTALEATAMAVETAPLASEMAPPTADVMSPMPSGFAKEEEVKARMAMMEDVERRILRDLVCVGWGVFEVGEVFEVMIRG